MFIDSDFDQIKVLLQRACDQCLLTRRHCENCNVDRLMAMVVRLEMGSKPSYLVPVEELAVLTDPASPGHIAVAEKWKDIVKNGDSTFR